MTRLVSTHGSTWKPGSTILRSLIATAVLVNASFGGSHVTAFAQEPSSGQTTAFVNGLWYDGSGFVPGSMYVRSGVFVQALSGEPTTTIDLEGAFVLPAFAEAHHHMVLCEPNRIASFIDAGILYAAILNARVSSRACQAEFHGNGSVEIVNALAGITASEAHPSQIGLYFLEKDEIEGEWVHFIDQAEDLDRVLARVEAGRPDLLKIFLSYSEDYAQLRTDKTIAPWYRGLDPAMVPDIVRKAHSMGLRVAAHVMSASDFEVAVDSNVDLVAHLPGFAPGAAFTDGDEHPYLLASESDPDRYRISSEVAARAAEQDIHVATTVSGGSPTASIAENLRTLRDAGVRLLIGSDRGEFNSVDEAVFLAENALMPAADVVYSLAVSTPQFLFPDRTIGSLESGAEATFVALRADPLANIGNLRDPLWVVQRGAVLRQP
ncbi:MAG: amidohydrolase family protein [Actinobacteria bacterium]|nr:amidohydrolase family protein [Actinomycetota bacterium]